MLFCVIMVALAVYLLYSVISGKGKLLATENIRKGKEAQYVKHLRLIYLVLAIVILFMAAFNFAEQVAYRTDYYYEFTDTYEGADGQTHVAGERHTVSEMQQIIIANESGSMCAPSEATDQIAPYRYVETTHTLKPQYSFLSFLSYEAAHTLNYVTLGVSMLVIIWLFIFIRLMTDQKAKKKAKEEAARKSMHPSMPSGAFDFEDYEDQVCVEPDTRDGKTEE